MHLRKHLSHPHTKKTQVQQKISQRQPKSEEAEAPGRAKAPGGAHTCRGRSQRAEPALVRAEAGAQGKQTPPRPSETAGGQVPRALCHMRGSSPHPGPDQVRGMCRAAPAIPQASPGEGQAAEGAGIRTDQDLLKTTARTRAADPRPSTGPGQTGPLEPLHVNGVPLGYESRKWAICRDSEWPIQNRVEPPSDSPDRDVEPQTPRI